MVDFRRPGHNYDVIIPVTITLLYYLFNRESDEYQLPPGQSMAYTWSDPCKKRELAWWLLSAKKETEKIMEIKV